MKFSLWTKYGALNSKAVFNAFKQGLSVLGHTVTENTSNADVDVIWSVLWRGRMAGNRAIYDLAQRSNRPVIVLEVGGIQRDRTWKVGLNGINRTAFAYDCLDQQRPQQLGLSLKPWQQSGDRIMICTQHYQSLQWQGLPSTSEWIKQTVSNIRKYSDRAITVRPHPRAPITMPNLPGVTLERPTKIATSYDDYDLNFHNLHAVVNWSSNPGIQSIINGVPAFTGANSIAAPVANLDFGNIENPTRPDRQQWLVEYAHTEWTVDEIATGSPIQRLMPEIYRIRS